jgi:predicted nucleic acid-binding protein
VRLYLDANAIIYAVEGNLAFRRAALDWIQRTRDSLEGQLLTSQLSRIECRSKPAAEGARDLLLRYDRFFQFARLGEVTAEVIERATDLRARFNTRTPDAIHLATAIRDKADYFLTGDRGLARCTDIEVVVLR